MTAEEDLKTFVDATWGNPSSITQTGYIFMSTDPDATELEPPLGYTATKVIHVYLQAQAEQVSRQTQGADRITYRGTVLIHSLTYAIMKVAIAEWKRLSEVNTTGDLIIPEPKIQGDAREGMSYFAELEYIWVKRVTRS